ncbi:autotransporter domain-containing protein [Reyranella sp.]|uniref:autotransporter family protein n=1 Tax=Reyranella sp. TaxID=1929291 RepID=UPI003BACCBB9
MVTRSVLAATTLLAGTSFGGGAQAQTWNLYSATTSFYIPYANGPMSPTNPAQIWLSLNGGTPTIFTMDTGSSGIIASAKNNFGQTVFPVSGPSLGAGSQYYSSSGVQLNGQFYLTDVSIRSSATTEVTKASVVALLVENQTCAFTNKGCSPHSDPTGIAYMGVGFDRGVSAITPPGPNTNVNPFINVNAAGPYSQGYLVTNSGVQLGLTNATTANYAFVKLAPNPSAAGQASAAWMQAPFTITVGGATGSGQILPDSGINYAFLTPPTGAQISTTACANPPNGPGGGHCASPGLPIQVYLPGQTSPQIAFYNFTTINGNPPAPENRLTPDVVQLVPDGPTVFLNTGREFFQGFNYFFDPVNGFVGYQWNGTQSTRYGNVIPIVALQGTVSLPALSSTFPTYLMSDTVLTSPGAVVLQGSVFGPGGLTVAGGDISLANPVNTYMGGTTVTGGSLSLAPGATLPSSGTLTVNGGAFNLNGNTQVLGALGGSGGQIDLGGGLLALNTSQSNVLGAALAGTGTFSLQGGGSVNLTGNSTGFSGSTVVTNAGLAVNGSLGGNVFVGSGGTVSGSGTIAGNLFNGGMVAPGNSIGTLSVAGNYSQVTGLYSVEVGDGGQSDLINVGGTASLGGAVSVYAQPGTSFAPSTTYRILTAAGGASGTFASVNELYPFLLSSLSYDANNAYLTLDIGGFAAAAATPTQAAVGNVLDANVGNATGDFATVLGALAFNTTSSASAQYVLQSLSGNNYAGFSTAMVQGAQLFMNNFLGQTGGGSGGGAGSGTTRVALAEACDVACDATSTPLWGAWGGALGGLGTLGNGAATGAVTYNAGGFAAGLDRAVAPGARVGITTGYTTGSQWVSGFNGMGRSDTVNVGLYGGYTQGPLYLDALAGYAYSWNQMWRQIAVPGLQQRTALGQTGANQWYGQLEGGWRFELGPQSPASAQAFVTPFARLQAYTGTQNGFTEAGAQSLNLSVAQQTTNSLRSVIGAQLGGSMDLGWRERLALQLRLGWSHEYADVSRPVTATLAGAPAMPFTTYGISPTRDGVVIGLGANTAIAEATRAYLRYEGNISGQDSAHALTAGLRMTW